ncbi:MAG: hypothetical protein H0V82_00370 [Candidatus Protochlamydia sp.]|nr:hypothetical protein [Candidatus Protochlamydia sp.]
MNQINHFQHLATYDFFTQIGFNLGIKEIVNCSKVCNLWNESISKNNILWEKISLDQGIFLVEGQTRNRKKDFTTLYPITISGSRIGKALGIVTEKIPLLNKKFIEILNDPDFEEPEKSIRETYEFVLFPSRLGRINEQKLNIVDNDLIYNRLEEKNDFEAPLTLNNFVMLSSNPLNNKKLRAVGVFMLDFELHEDDSYDPEFDYSYDDYDLANDLNPHILMTEKITIYFMRKKAIRNNNLSWLEKGQYVANKGFQLTPIFVRTFANCIHILESQTCEDTDWIASNDKIDEARILTKFASTENENDAHALDLSTNLGLFDEYKACFVPGLVANAL